MPSDASDDRPLTDREQWVNRLTWLDGCDIQTELQQARDEGRDLGDVAAAIERLLAVPKPDDSWFVHLGGQRDGAWLAKAGEFVDAVQQRPFRGDYPYVEPSDLPGILAARPTTGTPDVPAFSGSSEQFTAQLHGGVLGRFCGCLLGKPVEGHSRAAIRLHAQATDNWPIAFYLNRPSDAQLKQIEAAKPSHLPKLHLKGQYAGEITRMVSDDDVNYTVIGHGIIEQFGAAFTPADVGFYWMSHVPLTHTCTAERIAYRNLAMSMLPPASATYRNPYREWIGAQIRADYFGYANPGNPQRAAEWAWRDACISHIRNGIYGEMWVAAMLAAAYVLDDWGQIIEAGLAQIPARCRLAQDVKKIITLHHNRASWEQAVDAIHAQWDERDHHGWCHTNSNAQVVTMALLFGEDNYEKTITRAVMAGFDTDCNGATAGSLWGVMHGVDAIPAKWAGPLNDQGVSSIETWRSYRISDLAAAMATTAIRNA